MRKFSAAFMITTALCSPASFAAHAYAQFGDIKYPAGFTHFDWANPHAPKGGEIRLTGDSPDSNFDKYNPFTLKGSAPPGLISSDPSNFAVLLFETLMTATMDEATTMYGLLAEDISVAADKKSATFRLNPLARFHDGSPVLAKDVKYSFERLTSPEADPKVRQPFSDIKTVVIVNERTVRFDFKVASAELPLIAGSMPIFSHQWGAGIPFDKVTTQIPIGSGPYKIGKVDFGRDITYERDPNYWARDLNVRRGLYNFDRITFKVYKDSTAQTEAFLAGEFDFNEIFISREWARTYTGSKFRSGELIKQLLPKQGATAIQAYMINIQREKFRDIRVRQALEMVMDFEWMNRQFFYNSYQRIVTHFGAPAYEAKGLPGEDELPLLLPLKNQLSPAVFNTPVPLPPSTMPPGSFRANLRTAKQLLAEAGWTYRDHALRNAKGEAFTIEFLENSPSLGRIITPMIQALEKLGIQATLRLGDEAMVKKRRDARDFDITSQALANLEAPGKDLLDRYSSHAAKSKGSYNLSGIQDPAVDALLQKVSSAQSKAEHTAALKALDRVLRHGHYMIPAWTNHNARVSYRAHRFGMPAIPPYFQAPSWAMSTWWSTTENSKP